jgi:AcrR family transcriptional regulator
MNAVPVNPGTTAPAPATRFARRRRETRARLLAAARELFAERGLHDTAISDIAARADVGLGTVYLHFQNKEELLTAIVDDDITALLGRIHEATAGLDSALARHRAGLRIYLEEAFARRATSRILFEQVPQAHAALRAARERWVAVVAALVREGVAAGEIRTDNPELIAQILVAIAGQAALWWTAHDAPGPEAVADTVSTLIERGLSRE